MEANTRFPLIPLDYNSKEKAVSGELLLRYDNGDVYLAIEKEGVIIFISITQAVYDRIKDDPISADSITVEIELIPGTITKLTLTETIQELININKDKPVFVPTGEAKEGQVIVLGPDGSITNSTIDMSTLENLGLATAENDGLLSKGDFTKLQDIEDNANNYIHPATHPADIIVETVDKNFVSSDDKEKLENLYTKEQLDNIVAGLEANKIWKPAVPTFDDLATTYPTPEEGWTVNVTDTDETYRYDADTDEWINISSNNIPLATEENDGLLSKENYIKLINAMSKLPLPVVKDLLTVSKDNGDITTIELTGTDLITAIVINITGGVEMGPIINTARSAHSSAGDINSNIIMGGYDGTTSLSSTEMYNGLVWTNSADLNVSRRNNPGCGVYNNALVVGGNVNNSNINTVSDTAEIYNGLTWTNSIDMNAGRNLHSVAGVSNSALVTGGSNYGTLDTTEIFNGTTWTNGSTLLSIREHHVSCGVSSNTLIVDGYNDSIYLNTTELLVDTVWTSNTNTNMSRQQVSGCGNISSMSITGGWSSNTLKSIETFDGTTWTNDTLVLNKERYSHSGAGNGDKAIVVGGFNGGEYLNSTEIYTRARKGVVNLYDHINKEVSDLETELGGELDQLNNDLDKVEGELSSVTGKIDSLGSNTNSILPYGVVRRYSTKGAGTVDSFRIVGGSSERAFTTSLSSSEFFNGSSWVLDESTLVTSVAYNTIVGSYDTMMSVNGATNNTTSSNVVQKFSSNVWSTSVDSLVASFALAGTGNTSSIITNHETSTYIFNGTTWTAGIDSTTSRTYHTANGVVENCILVGGPTNEQFNGTAWSNIQSSVVERTKHSSSGAVTSTVIMGGVTTGSTVTEIYTGEVWKTTSLIISADRYDHASGGNANAVIVAGGTVDNTEVIKTPNYFLESLYNEGASVSKLGVAINTARYDHSSVGISTDAVVLGGMNSSNSIMSSIEIFDGEKWTNGIDITTATMDMCTVGITTNILLSGGSTEGAIGVNTSYLFNGTAWNSAGNLNTARSNHNMNGNPNNALMFNGANDTDIVLNKVELYNSTAWISKEDSLQSLNSGSSCGLANNLITAGGSTGSENTFHTYVYNGTTWFIDQYLPYSLSNNKGMVGTVDNCILFGGHSNSNVISTILKYNGSEWSIDGNLITGRNAHSGTGETGAALVVGGKDTAGAVLATTEIIGKDTLDSKIEDLINKVDASSITFTDYVLRAESWKYNAAGERYEYLIENEIIKNDSEVELTILPDSYRYASFLGFYKSFDLKDGSITLMTELEPTLDMVIDLRVN